MESRPIFEIEPSPLDKRLEDASLILLIVFWLVVIQQFLVLPDIIPTHFNAAGIPDDYNSKASLFLLPVIATALYILLTLINRNPHQFNYPLKITPENARWQYTLATRLIRMIKIAIVLTMFLVLLLIVLSANGDTKGLEVWILPAVLTLIFAPIVYYFVQSRRKDQKA